jgi:uncharacterized phage-like protein YoqJ
MKRILRYLLIAVAVLLATLPVVGYAAQIKPAPQAQTPAVTAKPAETQEKQFVIEDRPTYFLVYDQSGEMTNSIYRSWAQMVRTVYHFPTYKLIEDADTVRQTVRATMSGNPDKAELAKIAKDVKADVLVILVVHQMVEHQEIGGLGWWDGPDMDTYVRTIASADIFAYNTVGDKFAKKQIREYDLKEMGTEEHPEDTIKWKLARVLTHMEGKPEI